MGELVVLCVGYIEFGGGIIIIEKIGGNDK